MKTLIAEDDFTSRLLMQELLKQYGETHTAVNGKEAIEAVRRAVKVGVPYDLICLDIMMPEMDGQQALREIREMEKVRGIISSRGVKIIMTTALADPQNVMSAFYSLCDAYLPKPIRKVDLISALKSLKLIP